MPYLEESWGPVAATLGYKSEEDMLRQLYVGEKYSIKQIAKLVGYSGFVVRLRLIRLGVELRQRGGNNCINIKRVLSNVPDEELFEKGVHDLMIKYNVHPSTVSNERRQRKKMKEKQMEVVK